MYLLSMKKVRSNYLIVKTYRGMVYLDIREYFPRDKEYIPTKKKRNHAISERVQSPRDAVQIVLTKLSRRDCKAWTRRVQGERGEQLYRQK